MADKDPQDTEVLGVIGGASIEPDQLIATLRSREYPLENIIEALQRAMERGKIALDGEGMFVVLNSAMADAA